MSASKVAPAAGVASNVPADTATVLADGHLVRITTQRRVEPACGHEHDEETAASFALSEPRPLHHEEAALPGDRPGRCRSPGEDRQRVPQRCRQSRQAGHVDARTQWQPGHERRRQVGRGSPGGPRPGQPRDRRPDSPLVCAASAAGHRLHPHRLGESDRCGGTALQRFEPAGVPHGFALECTGQPATECLGLLEQPANLRGVVLGRPVGGRAAIGVHQAGGDDKADHAQQEDEERHRDPGRRHDVEPARPYPSHAVHYWSI